MHVDCFPDMNVLYIHAAALHFRLTVFFDSTSMPMYDQYLRQLWLAIIDFVEHAVGLKSEQGESVIKYATNYIQQMLTAAGFALLKLLNSPFAQHINFDYGKTLFSKVIETMRTISVSSHDLPCRLTEVLLQLWKVGGVDRKVSNGTTSPHHHNLDYSLKLKVRCRMSMSLIYDSVWRWREEFQNEGYEKLEGKTKPPPCSHSPPPHDCHHQHKSSHINSGPQQPHQTRSIHHNHLLPPSFPRPRPLSISR